MNFVEKKNAWSTWPLILQVMQTTNNSQVGSMYPSVGAYTHNLLHIPYEWRNSIRTQYTGNDHVRAEICLNKYCPAIPSHCLQFTSMAAESRQVGGRWYALFTLILKWLVPRLLTFINQLKATLDVASRHQRDSFIQYICN